MTAHSEKQSHIAIVGTGLAGLVTAYLLHNDPKHRYRVTLFERLDRVSLGAASVLLQDKAGQELVDVPMRSFAPGYYSNLKSMFDYLHIPYAVEKFLYAFSRDTGNPYYIHASNRHHLVPPRPAMMDPIHHLLQVAYMAVCYLWLSICCWVVDPLEAETLECYLSRVRFSQSWTAHYILPLISSVSTCSHHALLQIPASDFVNYKRKLYRAEHCTVTDGVWGVERKLLPGIDVRVSCEIQEVKPLDRGVRLSWKITGGEDARHYTDVFDDIVLAVSPNIVARIFTPLRDVMSRIPTVDVQSCIIQPLHAQPRLSVADETQKALHRNVRGEMSSAARFLSLRTDSDWTVTYQGLRSGAFVVTNAKTEKFENASVLTKARFQRVLRTVESQRLVNQLFSNDKGDDNGLSKPRWRNGDGGVWIAGAWCWDGMVLLEGCVVSAIRIADAFDVQVPWRKEGETV